MRSEVPLTGDRFIDGMLQGSRWESTSISLSLSDGVSGEAWRAPQTMASYYTSAASQMVRYTNLSLSFVGEFDSPTAAFQSGSDLNLSIDANNLFFSDARYWGRSHFPDDTNPLDRGDVYLNVNSGANQLPTYAPGSLGYFLLLHELGHSLGLKHPHDSGGTGRPTFTELAIEPFDYDLFTVMSYNDTDFDLVRYNPATPMVLDVLALQHLYGVDQTTNSGNTQWTATGNSMYQTWFDPAGVNSIVIDDSLRGWDIQLPDEPLSEVNPQPIGWLNTKTQSGEIPDSFYWLIGSFDGITGSPSEDQITGNASNNELNGGGGDDRIDGGSGDDRFDWAPDQRGGNDTFLGGPGDDFYVLNSSGDSVLELENQGDDLVFVGFSEQTSIADHIEQVGTFGTAAVDLIGPQTDTLYFLDNTGGRIQAGPSQDQLLTKFSANTLTLQIGQSMHQLYNRDTQTTIQFNGIEQIVMPKRTVEVGELNDFTEFEPSQLKDVIDLYIASFNRAPDQSGLVYWLNQLEAGVSINMIARGFFIQPESLGLELMSQPNETFVQDAYDNLFNRQTDSEGLRYWIEMLETQQVERSDFLLALIYGARANPGATADIDWLNTKQTLAASFAIQYGGNDGALGATAVSENAIASGLDAIEQIYSQQIATSDQFIVQYPTVFSAHWGDFL